MSKKQQDNKVTDKEFRQKLKKDHEEEKQKRDADKKRIEYLDQICG